MLSSTLYPLYALFLSILVQGITLSVGLFLQRGFGLWPLSLTLCSLFAFYLAQLMRLTKAWQLINSLLPALFVLFVFTRLSMPVSLISLGLLIGLLIYIPTFWTRVPFYPTTPAMYHLILAELPEQKHFRFVDLGSGFGTLLFYLAAARPDASFVGVEISPLAFLISLVKQKISRSRNVSFAYQDFWKMNFGDFDIVYAFLAPPPMQRVWQKFQAESFPGQIFMTNSFEVPATPGKVVKLDDQRQQALYVFRMP